MKTNEVEARCDRHVGEAFPPRCNDCRREQAGTRFPPRHDLTTFQEKIRGYGHIQLSSAPSYPKFREALADLVDESPAALDRFLGDIRMAVLSSPFGSPCPEGEHGTAWPHRGSIDGASFIGFYKCATCSHQWRAVHDITAVNWRN